MARFLSAGLALCLVAAAGCGGGGGGGSGPSVPYTGLTTQAKLTDSNVQDFASLAVGGVDLDAIGGFALRQAPSEGPPVLPGPLSSARYLRDFVLQRVPGKQAPRAQRVVQESGSEDGPCGGSVAFKIKVDDQTGAFSGSINFRNYCDEGVLNGGASFSGQINLFSGSPEYLTLSFGALTFEDAMERMAMGGSMSFDFRNFPTTTFAMTANVRDETEGKTYRFQDYFVATTDTGAGATLDTRGLCYHPDHGYVDFKTVTPLHINLSDLYPSSGSLRGDGSDGTWAVLSALSATQCQIQADTNGDGTLDWDSGPMAWTEL